MSTRRVIASATVNSTNSTVTPEDETLLKVVKRPHVLSHRSFPSRESFQQAGSRRLQAEGPKPPRDLYMAEEGGHRFIYEYAGHAKGRILNVDHEPAVAALSCGVPTGNGVEYRMQLHWCVGRMPGVDVNASWPALRSGDFITGSAAWGCGLSAAGFMVEVLDVAPSATTDDKTTTVFVHAVSPLHAVQDLYIDLQWTLPGRRLQGNQKPWIFEPNLPVIGFNVHSDGTIKEQNIDAGPLTCENCKVALLPSVQFRMETDGALPRHVSLTVGADVNVSVNVGLSQAALDAIERGLQDLNTVGAGFQRVQESFGPDLVAPALAGSVAATNGLLLPLFTLVSDVLDIELVPFFATDILLFTAAAAALLEDVKVSVGVFTGLNFTVAWDVDKGFSVTAAIGELESTIDVIGATAFSNFTAGIRACLGFHLRALGIETPLTALEGCPEFRMFVQHFEEPEVPELPVELLANTLNGTEQFCFEFQSFSTDADLDSFNRDEPYGKVCLFGACKQTSHGHFNFLSNTVQWSDGPLCLQAPTNALQDGMLAHLHLLEDDPVWDDQYTQPHALLLTSLSCPGLDTQEGCHLRDLDVPLYARGSFARVTVKITRGHQRLLTANERSLVANDECLGTAVSLSMGVIANFGGFHYPSFFSRGSNQQVVDPVVAPVVKPNGPKTTCQPAETSLATTMKFVVFRSVIFLLVVTAVWGS